MTSADLTDEQREKLFGIVERQRQWFEQLYQRCQQFPPDNRMRMEARRTVVAYRELAVAVNMDRSKGVAHQFQRRAAAWEPLYPIMPPR